MITKKQYVEYLLSTPFNYTCTNMAEHLRTVSHDVVNNFLSEERLTSSDLWKTVNKLIVDSSEACIIVDDSVQDKRHSNAIEMVKNQYSGNEHGLVKGIGIVNMVHSGGKGKDFYPIDFRIYNPEDDGKTKNDHFQDMFASLEIKKLQAKTILFDCWYASVDNLKLIHRSGWTFFTTLKANRLVSLSPQEGYVHLDELEWNKQTLAKGISVKLKELPFRVKLFNGAARRVVAKNGDIDWVITNDLDSAVNFAVIKEKNDTRWQVEEFHRGFKQLTGSERCQCRKARKQRNHLACCYHAWVSLKVKAKELGQTLYQVRKSLFFDYLQKELSNPRIQAI